MEEIRTRLINLVALCAEYCSTVESCLDADAKEITDILLGQLPRIYYEFHDIDAGESVSLEEWGVGVSEHLDEDQYESVRMQLATAFGEDDSYLETFEKDMKYSDTPIATTISENLADIYQPLYDFVVETRESEGENLEEAYRACKESFREYWSQTLCNVLRALNAINNSTT
ncbi:MAG: DUF5063 domain-containing protein [Muribaculaceae bacterium]|nr:DUF5063 domain-containing protein [Muribaculaceae bacterium]